jgi:SMODS and SLOG-associating 2TM effector domain family 5
MRQNHERDTDDIIDWEPRRTQPKVVDRVTSQQKKYSDEWRLVKRASFNASKRFQLRQDVGTSAIALSGVAGFLVPICSLVFADSITAHHKNVLDFSSYVVGALSLVIGLIEQSKDYPSKSRKLHECGLAVNKARRRLNLREQTADSLEKLIEDYERALDESGENHDEIDYEIATAQENLKYKDDAREEKEDKEKYEAKEKLLIAKARQRLNWLRLKMYMSIYGIYTVVIAIPIIVGAFFWVVT